MLHRIHRFHRTEGEFFATVDGKKLYQQDQALGTRAEDRELNATQEELAHAIEGSGQILNDATTDKGIGDFINANQLLEAIMRLHGRTPVNTTPIQNTINGLLLTNSIPAYQITSADFSVPATNIYFMLTETGGPFTNGIVRLPENSLIPGRIIFVNNQSGSRKRIVSSSDDVPGVWIQDQGIACFVGNASFQRWMPINYQKASGTFTVELRQNGGGDTLIASGTAKWQLDEDFVDLVVPPGLTGIIPGTFPLMLTSFGNANLPSLIQSTSQNRIAASVIAAGTSRVDPFGVETKISSLLAYNSGDTVAIHSQTMRYSKTS